jgi:hypothetical protein
MSFAAGLRGNTEEQQQSQTHQVAVAGPSIIETRVPAALPQHEQQKTEGISGFLDFIHRPVFEGTRRFGNRICFRPQVKRGKKTPSQLGTSDRANLNHWTTAV